MFSSLSATEALRFYNGKILKNHKLVEEELWVSDGKIIAARSSADYEFDAKGYIIAPGYIDLQINGAFGVDFSTHAENVADAAKKLPKYGVIGFLPTIVSLEKENYSKLLPFLKPQKVEKGATILGAHLEGPFFAKNKRGAHSSNAIIENCAEFESFYGDLNCVKIVTLAPELPNAINAIEKLKSLEIIISAGHTEASYQHATDAIGAGLSMATHLFNAMSPLNHRIPNLVTAFLTNELVSFSIIADGFHVAPEVIKLAWKANPQGLILITDAIEALGEADGFYKLADNNVFVKEGKATIVGNDTLAGSVLSLDAAVRNLKSFTGCNSVDAIEAASYKPAKILGLKNKGHLNVGADADFILLDENLFVQKCFIAGKQIFSAN